MSASPCSAVVSTACGMKSDGVCCRFKHFSDISMFPDALKAESLICMPLRETPNATMERIASVFVVEPAHGEYT